MSASFDGRYRLRAGVRARCEEFGALLYDPDSEAIYVVYLPAAMALFRRLDGVATLREVLHAGCGDQRTLAASEAIIRQLVEWGVLDEV